MMMSLPGVTFMLSQEQKRRLSFREDLTKLINKHGRDSRSDTQDFILADYLMDCLEAFDKANRRKVFHTEEGERKT